MRGSLNNYGHHSSLARGRIELEANVASAEEVWRTIVHPCPSSVADDILPRFKFPTALVPNVEVAPAKSGAVFTLVKPARGYQTVSLESFTSVDQHRVYL